MDTSVFGGCEDEEFRVASRRLFDVFYRGDATLLFSEATRLELKPAPSSVSDIVEQVPKEHIETLSESQEASRLADAYYDQ